ncbi:FMN-dependent dehydrogenase [Paraphaeosphaeria sporulosa]
MDALGITTSPSPYNLFGVPDLSETILVLSTFPIQPKKIFIASEVAAHNTSESLYLSIHAKVYDLTDFQHSHPGGRQSAFSPSQISSI